MELRKLLSEARWFLKIIYIIKFSKDEKFLGEASEHLVEKDLRLIFVL